VGFLNAVNGRGGSVINVIGLKGRNRDSVLPRGGYRAIAAAGGYSRVEISLAQIGVGSVAMGILDERGGKDTVVEGLVALNGSSSCPDMTKTALESSTAVVNCCDSRCAEILYSS
jgi:hypothetical protein